MSNSGGARTSALVLLAAVPVGLISGLESGSVALGVMVALAGGLAVLFGFAQNPARTLVVTWYAVLFQLPAASLAARLLGSGTADLIKRLDDGVVLILLVATVLVAQRSHRLEGGRWIWLGAGVFLGAGLLSSVTTGTAGLTSLLGAWLDAKFWIVLLIALNVRLLRHDRAVVLRAMVTGCTLAAASGALDIIMRTQLRSFLGTTGRGVDFRSAAVQGMFPGPGRFATVLLIGFAICGSRFLAGRSRSDGVRAAAFGVGSLLSLRLAAALGFVVVGLVVVLTAIPRNSGKAPRTKPALQFVLVGVVLGSLTLPFLGTAVERQAATYVNAGDATPRERLYDASLDIAASRAPLGEGFARYASFASTLNYSDVYYRYGFNNVWGLSKADPDFLTDTSWPAVLGESGFLGLAGYLVALASLVRLLARSPSRGIALSALAALLVGSLSGPSLFDVVPVLAVAMLACVAVSDRGSDDEPAERLPTSDAGALAL